MMMKCSVWPCFSAASCARRSYLASASFTGFTLAK